MLLNYLLYTQWLAYHLCRSYPIISSQYLRQYQWPLTGYKYAYLMQCCTASITSSKTYYILLVEKMSITSYIANLFNWVFSNALHQGVYLHLPLGCINMRATPTLAAVVSNVLVLQNSFWNLIDNSCLLF